MTPFEELVLREELSLANSEYACVRKKLDRLERWLDDQGVAKTFSQSQDGRTWHTKEASLRERVEMLVHEKMDEARQQERMTTVAIIPVDGGVA